jgi:predicted glycoside hydrolase/deacetylase ChbG (UPF0249 family)
VDSSHGVPVVVVADDFGHSPATNAGIVRALAEHLITSASLLANMPGFDEAVALTREHGLHGRIGAHLNLVEGTSLTAPIRTCPRFAREDGTLIWKHHNIWRVSAAERAAITTEWRAQIARIVEAGIQPSHIDSHTHTHTAWPLGTVANALAKEFGIRHVRLTRNCGPPVPLGIRAYKALYNARLRRAGLSPFQYFGRAEYVGAVLARATGPVEVMTHPQLDETGRLMDHTEHAELAPTIHALNAGDRLLSHSELPV